MIVLGDAGDQLDDVGDAAGTLAALLESPVNLCRHDDFPRIGAEKGEDDLLDLPIGDHIALADEHGPFEAV
jgi:hypothetical protein